MHAGVDAGSGLVHTVEMTPANGSDIASAHKLVRPDDRFCYGDSGYTGVEKREEVAADPHLSSVEWIIARKPSSIRSLDAPGGDEREIERRKASVRSRVEHPFKNSASTGPAGVPTVLSTSSPSPMKWSRFAPSGAMPRPAASRRASCAPSAGAT